MFGHVTFLATCFFLVSSSYVKQRFVRQHVAPYRENYILLTDL